MIDRYALPEIADLFTDEARFRAWLEVEILATEAWAKLGRGAGRRRRGGPGAGRLRPSRRSTSGSGSPSTTSPPSSTSCRSASAAPAAHVGALRAHVERRRRHRAVGDAGAGRATSCIDAVAALEAAITAQAHEHRDTPMVGRTHGIHAEPTTFGAKLALWALQVRRDRERLARAREAHRGRQAVGRGRHLLQRRPRGRGVRVRALGLTPVPATQVIARDRHAELLYACASLGATDRVVRHRDPSPPAHRGARGARSRSAPARRRARARCRTSATR